MRVVNLPPTGDTRLRKDFERRFFEKLSKGLRGRNLSLMDFAEEFWPIIEPGRVFQRHWALEFIAEYLELVTEGQAQRVIFNLPPRSGKSNLVSVIWPAWDWTKDPTRRGIFASYAQGLGVKHSIHRRAIIQSDTYCESWGGFVSMTSDQNMKSEYENTRLGRHDITSPGGTVTGKGGDYIVLDDLINPDEADSAAARNQAFNFIDRTLLTRLDDKKRGAIVCIEQRLGVKDVTAHLKEKTGSPFEVFTFPAIAERKMIYTFPKSKRVVIRKEGDILWPERESAENIEAQKLDMGTSRWRAQYQQDPRAVEGSILKREWWQEYRELPKSFKRIVWSWDTAHKKGQTSDYSVGILVGETEKGFFVIDIIRRKMEFPELKRTVKDCYSKSSASIVLVEDKASGQDLIPELKRNTTIPIKPVKVDKDKVARVNYVAPGVESGNWFLPEMAKWKTDFIDECADFPNGDHDDQVDAFSQAAKYLKDTAKVQTIFVHEWKDEADD